MMTNRSKTTTILAAAFGIYITIALYIDIGTELSGQLILSASTWLFLALALGYSPRQERISVFVMIAVATIFECLCSLAWGVYVYRLDNLPLYVPPGHGLFYLMAIRLAELSRVVHYGRWIVRGALYGGIVHFAGNLILFPQPDLLGLVNALIFIPFVMGKRYAHLYAVSFGLTMALEFYGTSLGNWAWMPVMPYVGISAANPPAFIGVGYCVMDGIARSLSPKLIGYMERKSPFRGFPAMVSE
jgi:hypothetical protein